MQGLSDHNSLKEAPLLRLHSSTSTLYQPPTLAAFLNTNRPPQVLTRLRGKSKITASKLTYLLHSKEHQPTSGAG